MSAATIRVRAPSGRLKTFDAERVEIADGLVTAVGCWRNDSHRSRSITWAVAARQLVEIRWSKAAG